MFVRDQSKRSGGLVVTYYMCIVYWIVIVQNMDKTAPFYVFCCSKSHVITHLEDLFAFPCQEKRIDS